MTPSMIHLMEGSKKEATSCLQGEYGVYNKQTNGKWYDEIDIRTPQGEVSPQQS
jgi:hypothetical protein